jgi:hypothetical protein
VTQFAITGRRYGGWCDFSQDERLAEFLERFAPCRVLELGCLEGGQTVELARRGYIVTAVEGRPDNVRRARWICRAFGAEARVVGANLEKTPLSQFGRHDVVFCTGLLYHLPRPWELSAQFAGVASHLFLSTHYSQERETTVEGLPGRWYRELGPEDPLSGLSARSFWPTKEALLGLLRAGGYTRIEIVRDVMHQNGPLVDLVASTRG